MRRALTVVAVSSLMLLASCARPLVDEPDAVAPDPLPSWNEGASRDAILDFVDRVTDPAGPDFVPEPERIAVFDNDGTLWSEQPLYFQLLFAIDRVEGDGARSPRVEDLQPFQARSRTTWKALAASGKKGILLSS
jgi:hypothetical protein